MLLADPHGVDAVGGLEHHVAEGPQGFTGEDAHRLFVFGDQDDLAASAGPRRRRWNIVCGVFYRRRRQHDAKGTAFSQGAAYRDLAAALFDDAVYRSQAETRPGSEAGAGVLHLGGEEGLEDPLPCGLVHARTVVGDRELHQSVGVGGVVRRDGG